MPGISGLEKCTLLQGLIVSKLAKPQSQKIRIKHQETSHKYQNKISEKQLQVLANLSYISKSGALMQAFSYHPIYSLFPLCVHLYAQCFFFFMATESIRTYTVCYSGEILFC